MTTPPPLTCPVRLDDLISAVAQAHEAPLDRLSAAVIVSEHLGDVADALLGHFVDAARRSGASWTEIGRSMGVTKQAAQKRFVAKPADGGAEGFARFTEAARSAVIVAHNAARESGSAVVTPGHLVLGLIADETSPAVAELRARGVAVDRLGDAVRAGLPAPAAEQPALIPFDDAAKSAIEGALTEAGDGEVGPEHLLRSIAAHEGEDGVLRRSGLSA